MFLEELGVRKLDFDAWSIIIIVSNTDLLKDVQIFAKHRQRGLSVKDCNWDPVNMHFELLYYMLF